MLTAYLPARLLNYRGLNWVQSHIQGNKTAAGFFSKSVIWITSHFSSVFCTGFPFPSESDLCPFTIFPFSPTSPTSDLLPPCLCSSLRHAGSCSFLVALALILSGTESALLKTHFRPQIFTQNSSFCDNFLVNPI